MMTCVRHTDRWVNSKSCSDGQFLVISIWQQIHCEHHHFDRFNFCLMDTMWLAKFVNLLSELYLSPSTDTGYYGMKWSSTVSAFSLALALFTLFFPSISQIIIKDSSLPHIQLKSPSPSISHFVSVFSSLSTCHFLSHILLLWWTARIE